jgi:hypothetical protein
VRRTGTAPEFRVIRNAVAESKPAQDSEGASA